MLEKYENMLHMIKIFLVIFVGAHFLAVEYHTVSIIELKYIKSFEK